MEEIDTGRSSSARAPARSIDRGNQHRLDALLDVFQADGFEGSELKVVPANRLPKPFRQLLVHNHHMTVTLEEHHGSPVHLVILDARRVGQDYARKLVLTVDSSERAGGAPPQRVVMAGLMHIQLKFCGEGVAKEILSGQTPLGRILIEHDVLRSIESHVYLRVVLGPKLAEMFGLQIYGQTTYGRVATISCDGVPAVELLEIVAPAAPKVEP